MGDERRTKPTDIIVLVVSQKCRSGREEQGMGDALLLGLCREEVLHLGRGSDWAGCMRERSKGVGEDLVLDLQCLWKVQELQGQ